MIMARAAGIAALFIWALSAAWAEDVTLTSRDGTVEITGNLLGFDGEFYRVDTLYGVLTLDGSGVVCEGPGCPDLNAYVARFTLSGSRTMGEVLLPGLVEAFAARSGYRAARQVTDDTHFTYVLTDAATGRPAAKIGFRVSSTAEGFADLLADQADIVLSTRAATAREIKLAREAGIGSLADPRRSRIVGLDAMVPVVAAANPVQDVSVAELAAVYSGKIGNWSELGGPDAPIALHLRDGGSGLAQAFIARVLATRDLVLAADVIRHASNSGLADAVARDPLALGIAAWSDTGNARALALRGTCGFILRATAATLKAEDYPLTAPLYLYTPARRLPVVAREFLAYLRSPAAQPVVDRAGFADLRLVETPLAAQGQRLAHAIAAAGADVSLTELQRLVAAMDGSARLSISFRFKAGTLLDDQSASNVDILAARIEAGAFDNRRLVFVGFSDGQGEAASNLALARRRAETVRSAILAAAATADLGRLRMDIDAFGEAMPLACDDTDWGRRLNRRVEVWVDQM